MCKQSSDQDSSLKDEKAKKEDRPSSSHRWRRRTWRWPIQAERGTPPQQLETSSGRGPLDQFSPSTRQVISQKGERTLLERLSTTRPAQKIVLKSAWQSQQQQQQQPNTSESAASGTRARKIHQVKRRVESYKSRTWQHWTARSGTNIQNRPVPFLLEAHTGRIDLLCLRDLSSTWWRKNAKNQGQIPDYDSSFLPCTSELLKR